MLFVSTRGIKPLNENYFKTKGSACIPVSVKPLCSAVAAQQCQPSQITPHAAAAQLFLHSERSRNSGHGLLPYLEPAHCSFPLLLQLLTEKLPRVFTPKTLTLSDHCTHPENCQVWQRLRSAAFSFTEENKAQCMWKKNIPEPTMTLLSIRATGNPHVSSRLRERPELCFFLWLKMD